MKALNVAITALKWMIYIMAGGLAAALLLMVGLWLHSYISPWVLGSGMTMTGLYLLYAVVVIVAAVFAYDRMRRSGEERLADRVKDELAIIRSRGLTTQRLLHLLGKAEEELRILEETRKEGTTETLKYCLAYEALYCRREAIKYELKERGAIDV